MRLALVAKTNSQEDVCDICTVWLLLSLEALSKNGAIIYKYMYLESHPASPILQRTFFIFLIYNWIPNLLFKRVYGKKKSLRSHAKLISDVPEYLMELVFVVNF